ncbi:MAG: phosphatidate cytidylyltransferase [Verrucomicrobiota bacterium]
MRKRILSTVGLWAVIIAVVAFFGSLGGILLLAALAALTQFELYKLLEKMGYYRPLKWTGTALGLIIIIGSYLLYQQGLSSSGALDVFALCMLLLSFSLIVWPEVKRTFLPTLFGLIYIPFMLQFYGMMIKEYGSVMVPIFIIAAAKFSDVGGLLFGMALGKHKLCPHISPNKTVEGAVGGIVTSAAIGALLFWAFPQYLPTALTLGTTIVIAAVIGVIALASDLIESILKRQAGVKDSGKAIPGIGGAFDLMDSLILTAPAGYLLFKYLV